MKLCNKCRVEKEELDFSPSQLKRNSGCCKNCACVKTKEWNARNPEKKLASRRKWAQDNTEKIKENNQKYYQVNKEKINKNTKELIEGFKNNLVFYNLYIF